MPEFTTARTAQLLVATMPPVTDERPRREILLHAALYRAAWATNVGDFTRHYLLAPRAEDPDIAGLIDPPEFRLRVIAQLADIGLPIAWVPPREAGGTRSDTFPGTKHLATRLGFDIRERSHDGLTVNGVIWDETAHVGSSRQRVTARWVDGAWHIERDRVRTIW
jgi:hypothetical protein